MKVLIIDGDSLVWIAAYNAEKMGLSSATQNLDAHLTDVIGKQEITHYHGYIGGSSLSRKAIEPTYKATRPARPEFYNNYSTLFIKYLVEKWKFEEVPVGLETDDAVAIAAEHYRSLDIVNIVYSGDKDLHQVEGMRYMPATQHREEQFLTFSADEALNYWHTQILVGDTTDNIKGLEGVGPVKAKKLLEAVENKSLAIAQAYIEKYGQKQGLIKLSQAVLMVTLGLQKFEIKPPVLAAQIIEPEA